MTNTMKLPLSVILLTHNEEDNIEDCLKSCAKFAREVIVVDDASEDRTVELASKCPEVKIFKRLLSGDFGAQKTFGISQAQNEWILLIDADERVTPQLEQAICSRVQSNEKSAYLIQRENHFKNMVVRHGSMRPDWVLRLMPREGAKVVGLVHEKVETPYPQKRITEGRLIHFPYRSWDQVYAKTDKYSRLAAIKLAEQGRPCGFFSHVLLHPIWAFIKVYIFNLGFLDGKAGYIFAANHAACTLFKYVRFYQLKHFHGEL